MSDSETDWRELVVLAAWVIEGLMRGDRTDLWFHKRDEFRLKASIALAPPKAARK